MKNLPILENVSPISVFVDGTMDETLKKIEKIATAIDHITINN